MKVEIESGELCELKRKLSLATTRIKKLEKLLERLLVGEEKCFSCPDAFADPLLVNLGEERDWWRFMALDIAEGRDGDTGHILKALRATTAERTWLKYLVNSALGRGYEVPE